MLKNMLRMIAVALAAIWTSGCVVESDADISAELKQIFPISPGTYRVLENVSSTVWTLQKDAGTVTRAGNVYRMTGSDKKTQEVKFFELDNTSLKVLQLKVRNEQGQTRYFYYFCDAGNDSFVLYIWGKKPGTDEYYRLPAELRELSTDTNGEYVKIKNGKDTLKAVREMARHREWFVPGQVHYLVKR